MKTEAVRNYDLYLVLCETEHETRYWRCTNDAATEPAFRKRVFGPALIGPNGYLDEEDAAFALADEAEVDLYRPHSWQFQEE